MNRTESDTQTLVTTVGSAWPPEQWRDVNVLAAVSGGADSVALCRCLAELKRESRGKGGLAVAHFNHHLRGAEADADQLAVEDLCQDLGIRCYVGHADSSEATLQVSEETARDTRYEFLVQTATLIGARYVATGHTLDDQVETVLHRVFRGSGLAGLTGIPFTRNLTEAVTLVRPLLGSTREQIEAYLAAVGQPFRHDSSNGDSAFTRNWIRNDLMPQLRDRFGPAMSESIAGLSKQAAETQDWVLGQAGLLRQAAIEVNPDAASMTILLPPLRDAPSLLVCEACRDAWRSAGWPEQDMGRQQWRQLAEFVQSHNAGPPIMLPGGIRAERCDDRVVLAPVS